MIMTPLGNKIIEGDCISEMRKIEAGSVDLILCDLPYGTTVNKWDEIIPFVDLWAEYERLLSENGCVILTGQGVFTAKLILSNEDWFKYKYVWVKSKSTNFLNARKQPLRKHEDICVFYRKQPPYSPLMWQGKPRENGRRKTQNTGSYGNFKASIKKTDGRRYTPDVIYCKTAEAEGRVWHPTQKPVALGRFLISTHSKPGDTVLDNCCGSGSFLVAAAIEKRNYIGIDKNEDLLRVKKTPVDCMVACFTRLYDTETKIMGGHDFPDFTENLRCVAPSDMVSL